MQRSSLGRRLADERGQSLVELALALPFLMFVVIAAVGFAQGINYWLDANHLANEGARWAMVNRTPAGTITSSTQLPDYMGTQIDQLNIQGSPNRCVTVTVPSSQVGQPVTVQVSVTFPIPFASSIGNFLGISKGVTSLVLHGDSTMSLEQTPAYGGITKCY